VTTLGTAYPTRRMLIADADADTRALYRTICEKNGWDAVEAADGRDALVKALSHRPTVIVTDTDLPILDGYALCEVIRKDSGTKTVPIVVVTTETSPQRVQRARDAGANIVLTKPMPPDALLSEIQRLLAREVEPSRMPVNNKTRRTQVKSYQRIHTTAPPNPPPDLPCPGCNRPLRYARSYLGGVNPRHAEQWDTYTCPASCGTFEYRQRTRTLRRVSSGQSA
jgi:two-component system chemotaxis response regulator CheY